MATSFPFHNMWSSDDFNSLGCFSCRKASPNRSESQVNSTAFAEVLCRIDFLESLPINSCDKTPWFMWNHVISIDFLDPCPIPGLITWIIWCFSASISLLRPWPCGAKVSHQVRHLSFGMQDAKGWAERHGYASGNVWELHLKQKTAGISYSENEWDFSWNLSKQRSWWYSLAGAPPSDVNIGL